MRKTYQITEYGSFVREKEVSGYTSLPKNTFDALEKFVLTNTGGEDAALDIMGLSARKSVGKIITAKNYVGSETAFALLFPMETLFESYIAAKLKKVLRGTEYSVSVQDKTYHLFDEPKKFLLKPDIVIRHRGLERNFIVDTKWKILAGGKTNYGISQADMYQMYAYQNKYHSESVTLLYPLTEKVEAGKKIEFHENDGTRVKVRFVDLFDLEQSLEGLIEEIRLDAQ